MTQKLPLAGLLVIALSAVVLGACATDRQDDTDRGVRACGIQPDWVLVLRPDHWLTFVTDKSSERYVAPIPPPRERGNTRTWHLVDADGVPLSLALQEDACQGPGGRSYPMTATVTFKERTLNGCARQMETK